MKKIQTSSKLWIFFVIVILVPSLLLGYFAVRTVEQEEAVLERQWKESLTIEVFHISSLIRQQLTQMERELDLVFAGSAETDLAAQVQLWMDQSDFIGVPFVLSAERYFLWPHYSNGLSLTEWLFIKTHFDFFKDRQTTPVFDGASIWKKSYDQPEDLSLAIKGDVRPDQKSLTFSQLIQGKSSGLIPQIIDNKLYLIYWQRRAQNEIVGCLINQDYLMTTILGILPQLYSDSRALNILNEHSRPIYGFKDSDPIDWTKPFLSARISDLLPFWEVAAYLTDPMSIRQNAKSSALLIWLMISVLILTILTGGYVIIKTLRNQIESAQQRATFAANVSHELRTPLTSLKLFVEMLGRDDITEVKRTEYLNIIQDETDRLNHLVNNVLDFSRARERGRVYNKKVCDLMKIVDDIVEKHRFPLQTRGFNLDYRPSAKKIMVECDAYAVQQVILNLIDNAVKYSSEHKTIGIEVSEDKDIVRVLVEDEGIGISPKLSREIFEPYYRVDDNLTSRTQGTGLGLTIADKIIKDHQGRITFRHKERGSIFIVELPIYKETV